LGSVQAREFFVIFKTEANPSEDADRLRLEWSQQVPQHVLCA